MLPDAEFPLRWNWYFGHFRFLTLRRFAKLQNGIFFVLFWSLLTRRKLRSHSCVCFILSPTFTPEFFSNNNRLTRSAEWIDHCDESTVTSSSCCFSVLSLSRAKVNSNSTCLKSFQEVHPSEIEVCFFANDSPRRKTACVFPVFSGMSNFMFTVKFYVNFKSTRTLL